MTDSLIPSGFTAVMARRRDPPDTLDFYPTPPWATRALLKFALWSFDSRDQTAWDPAAGEGHMAEVLRESFRQAHASDVHDYGCGYQVGSYIGQGADKAEPVHKTFGNGYEVVWDLDLSGVVAAHPSVGDQGHLKGGTRIDASWTGAPRDEPGMRTVNVKVPHGFTAAALEVSFRQSVIDQTPDEIGVYAFDGTRGVRLNQDHSGEWIESLAADALVRRASPVATVTLNRTAGDLQVEFRHSENPPIERIVLIGGSTR